MSFARWWSLQEAESNGGKDDFIDPLRAPDEKIEVSAKDVHHEYTNPEETLISDISAQLRIKEWNYFKKSLMQKFPLSKTIPISMVGISLKPVMLIRAPSIILEIF